MSRAGRHVGVLLKDFSYPLERSQRRIRHGISDGVIRPGPTPFRPHEVVLAGPDKHHRPLDILLRSDLLEDRAIGERNEAGKVVLQAGDIAVSPAAVNHVILAIGIAEYRLVDG